MGMVLEYHLYSIDQDQIDKWGWEWFYLEGTIESGYDWDVHEITKTYDEAVDVIKNWNKKDPIAFAAIWKYRYEGDESDRGNGEYTDDYKVIIDSRPRATINNNNLFKDIILKYIRE
jgi:hypothetical protein